ncbi:hypothetical protein B0E43_17495 [Algoriphagus sp. A40]|nr:hypothetical protein B0E43_17495 [Algoriphagus sp. A40]
MRNPKMRKKCFIFIRMYERGELGRMRCDFWDGVLRRGKGFFPIQTMNWNGALAQDWKMGWAKAHLYF